MISIFLSFSKIFSDMKTKQGKFNLENSQIDLFNVIFNTSIKRVNNTVQLCEKATSMLTQITSSDLDHIRFLEQNTLKEQNEKKRDILIVSIGIIYEQLFSLSPNHTDYLNILLGMNTDEITILSHINEGLNKHISLGINYFSLSSKETTLRQIDPYFIKEHLGQLYVVGFCHKHKSIRTFLVKRMKGVTETYSHFEKPRKATNNELFKFSLGIYLGDKDAQWIELKCKNHLLPILKSHPIHPRQTISLDSTNYFTVKCQLVVTDELKRKLLQYGADVEVLYPKSLIQLLNEETDKIKSLYR